MARKSRKLVKRRTSGKTGGRKRTGRTSRGRATPKGSSGNGRTLSARLRILLADDQPIDRRGLASLLQSQPDLEVVGEADTTESAAAHCRNNRPSVVLLALRLTPVEGQTALSYIRSVAPDVPILAIAERGEGHCLVLNPPGSGRVQMPPEAEITGCASGTDCLQLAVAQGANGTIRRSADPEELFRAIRTVASGKAWYEAGTATAIMRHALARRTFGAVQPLSGREIEVAELISNGRSNKEIAHALGISEPTVKKHVGHILGKLHLQDRLQLGLYIARNPLVLKIDDTRRR